MTQNEVYKILERNGSMSINEIIEALGSPRSTVYYCLSRMLINGTVERRTVSSGRYIYYSWRIKDTKERR